MTTDSAPTTDASLTSLTVESTDGCQIALHYLGGSGPDVIICHATGFHGRVYGPLAASLVGDFTVWGIDMRGHGASTAPRDGDFAWRGMAEDLLACVDALEADSIAAVGHSLGGAAILLAYATQLTAKNENYTYEAIAKRHMDASLDKKSVENAKMQGECLVGLKELNFKKTDEFDPVSEWTNYRSFSLLEQFPPCTVLIIMEVARDGLMELEALK